jgi:hypothetical protein
MAKPGYISAKPLSVLLSDVFSDAYAKQGFAAGDALGGDRRTRGRGPFGAASYGQSGYSEKQNIFARAA